MSEVTPPTEAKVNASLLIRGAIWVAIGALIAAALVCVVWVLIGDQDGIIGRAFLTIVLLAGFAGIAILEASLASRRPEWLALASMITWIVALLVGAVKIWLPDHSLYGEGGERFFQLLLVIGILQLALLHVRLFTPAAKRYVTTFTTVIYYVTVALLVLLVGLLVFFLTFPDLFDYVELYWRIVVALTILVAVGTTLIPLLNALFAPKKTHPQPAVQTYAPAAPVQQQWPTYADGVTPLPVLYDGSPDWNAYYTGYPTAQTQPAAVAPAAEAYPSIEYTEPAGAADAVPQVPAAPEPAAAEPSGAPDVPAAPQVPAAPEQAEQQPAPEAPAAPQHHVPGAFPPPPPAPPQ